MHWRRGIRRGGPGREGVAHGHRKLFHSSVPRKQVDADSDGAVGRVVDTPLLRANPQGANACELRCPHGVVEVEVIGEDTHKPRRWWALRLDALLLGGLTHLCCLGQGRDTAGEGHVRRLRSRRPDPVDDHAETLHVVQPVVRIGAQPLPGLHKAGNLDSAHRHAQQALKPAHHAAEHLLLRGPLWHQPQVLKVPEHSGLVLETKAQVSHIPLHSLVDLRPKLASARAHHASAGHGSA
mmetsp:Transcript_9941/g.21081  ORF Transcript_9941/g.21081 Transcript_9941/m.21081 type:complete len:238 (+) Transcript_9941:155-868(+)